MDQAVVTIVAVIEVGGEGERIVSLHDANQPEGWIGVQSQFVKRIITAEIKQCHHAGTELVEQPKVSTDAETCLRIRSEEQPQKLVEAFGVKRQHHTTQYIMYFSLRVSLARWEVVIRLL